jgi:hypothetical protein
VVLGNARRGALLSTWPTTSKSLHRSRSLQGSCTRFILHRVWSFFNPLWTKRTEHRQHSPDHQRLFAVRRDQEKFQLSEQGRWAMLAPRWLRGASEQGALLAVSLLAPRWVRGGQCYGFRGLLRWEGGCFVMSTKKEENRSWTQEPGEERRRVLRWLYQPWVWLVFIPYLVLSTICWGIVAVLISLVSPRVAFHCGTIWSWCLCRLNRI